MKGWLSVWTPLPVTAWLRRPTRPPPFPLAEPGCTLYEEGRDAVWHGIRALGLGEGDEVLSPAYHAGPDVEAMVRAGIEVSFYAGRPNLEPDEDELQRIRGPRTRALYLVHYLGFPQDAQRWRRWCDDNGMLLIEDAAQAWLSERDGVPVGSFGDLALWSLYKMVPTPDGTVAVCSHPLSGPADAAGLRADKLIHMHGAWLGQRCGGLRRLRPRDPEPFDAIAHFDLGDPDAPPARTTRYLARRLGGPEVAGARRDNYRQLLHELADHVPAPFDWLPEGACPWFFPVESEDRAGMLQFLASRGVGAMAFWEPAHPALDHSDFPEAAHRRETAVALPVHHQLRPRDVFRIAAAASAWYRR
ncbi:MAG: DegT/DnrJ/EryC1/StrS family aminotransferase [Solirubrobacterales bacterium]